MERLGWSIDWDRVLATHEPEYYRWTQWLFLRFLEHGLVYRKNVPVKWCPQDQTVLANEQVVDGHCERCGALVEAKNLEQWLYRITAYADALRTAATGGNQLTNTAVYGNPSNALGSVMVGNSLYFDGPHVNALGGRARMYAPSTWADAGSCFNR